MSCPTNSLTCVIPSEAKESRSEIATSLTLLAMTMYRGVRDRTLARTTSVRGMLHGLGSWRGRRESQE